ncbi:MULTISPECIES: A/G-specific adenine glycosylase [unclassified Brevibacterium]|uniref:A/G-specific adenine glycosylase n=1 Tax=unclassified Brevibacterium TaxID=2614124 RepID=UPI0010F7DFB2|nr:MULTISPECIES: A/G-specific adenine glycosylase [unclassified Brevibacterium]MCM1013605.1 A/G-specific adenine glycosylase [Brevibacterium sp. XM4083]
MTHRTSAETGITPTAPVFPDVPESAITRVQTTIIDWFEAAARPLPWRAEGTSAWAVLVSEIMSQQTPVSRVAPRWSEWLERWPTPADLAAAPTAEVLQRWDRLGYPRRALRLQEAARVIADDHDNQVPDTAAALETLPGIGSYTAAAVASFAHGERTTVLDTNVRRVLVRVFAGRDRPTVSPSRRETVWAERFVPATDHVAWNAGVMEFGALVCTARSPKCEDCPLADICAWNLAGRPASAAKPKTQKWAGTDRQLRGAIMDVLKAAHAEAAEAGNRSTSVVERSSVVPGSSAVEKAANATTGRASAATDAIAVDLFTAPTAELDDERLGTLGPTTSAKLTTMRDLSADADRISRLIADLVTDGLAHRSGDRLSLPR